MNLAVVGILRKDVALNMAPGRPPATPHARMRLQQLVGGNTSALAASPIALPYSTCQVSAPRLHHKIQGLQKSEAGIVSSASMRYGTVRPIQPSFHYRALAASLF
jgi:hypothetical protein